MPQTAQTNTRLPMQRFSTFVGGSNSIRTDYPTAGLGEVRREGNITRIYVRAPAAVPAGGVAVTVTAATSTPATDGSGTLIQATAPDAVVAAGTGWTSDAAFAAGEYGWVYKAAAA